MKLGVEGAAYLQRHTALGPHLLCQLSSPIHSGGFPANDQLAGAVVVTNLYHAQLPRLIAGQLQRLPLHAKDGGHTTRQPRYRRLHGLSAQRHGFDGGIPI